MFAIARMAEGLLLAHLFIGFAFLIGSNAVSWCRRECEPAVAMMRLVCTCALGFALIGFGTFAIAAAGLFTPAAAAVTAAILFAGGCAIAKESPFTAAYWTARGRMLVRAFDIPHLLVYLALVVVAMPAVNLSNAGADALAFHWAYVMDWIHAHGLVVDPFLREPFYAQNDLLLVALVFLFGAGTLAQFAMWMFGLLTALGICAGVRSGFKERGLWPAVIGVLLALAVTYAPEYLRWLDTGYLDVALGFFALASALALMLAVDAPGDWRWLTVCAAIAAFLIGSKTSLLPFVLVYAALLAIAARGVRCSKRQLLLALAVLAILAAPWYARNIALAGDPIPPLFNLALHGRDGLDTRFDVKSVAQDFSITRTPSAIASIPVRAFFDPDTLDFREFATNALILLLYVPTAAIFFAGFVFRVKTPRATVLPVLLLTVAIAYWIATATAMRYGLLFFPLLGLCLGLVAGMVTLPLRRTGPVFAALAAAALLITPNAEAHNFYSVFFINGVQNPPKYYTADDPFFQKFVLGYTDEQYTVRVLRTLGLHGRVYVSPGNYIHYFYRRDGVESIGDWVGPAAAFWLYHATATGQAPEFLRSLDVDAVLLYRPMVFAGLSTPIARQLRAAGYCSVPIPTSAMLLLVDAPQGCARVSQALSRMKDG